MTEERLPWEVTGCSPGEWRGLVRPDLALLLAPDEDPARVGELWAAAQRGAGFDGVLDLLVRDGVSRCGGFVLVGAPDGVPRMIVRGDVGVATHPEPAETGTPPGAAPPAVGTRTWREVPLSGVAGLTVTAGDSAAAAVEPLPVTGLVDVAALVFGSAVPAATGTRDAVSRRETATREAPAAPVTTAAPVGPPSPGPAPTPAAEPAPPAEPEPAPTPVDLAPAQPGPADEDDHTYVLSRRTDASADHGAPDADGDSGAAGSPSPLSRPVARLEFSHGEVVEVDRTVLVGRAPEARRFSVDARPRLVTVPSPLGEVSATHVEVRPGTGADQGSAVVTDLGSTNGTRVSAPGLAAEEVAPGVVTALPPGAVVDLGDGVTIQVAHG